MPTRNQFTALSLMVLASAAAPVSAKAGHCKVIAQCVLSTCMVNTQKIAVDPYSAVESDGDYVLQLELLNSSDQAVDIRFSETTLTSETTHDLGRFTMTARKPDHYRVRMTLIEKKTSMDVCQTISKKFHAGYSLF